jgi:non-specific serine/threonine protein kinase
MSESGTLIGPYEIVTKLGEGGMGEVYLARDTRLGREVAIKMLPADMAHDPDRLGRFRREALTLAALNHPNIATIHGFEETDTGALALILERVQGETLGDRMKRGLPPVEEALGICAQIAEALEVAHEQGVIHRDLKPGNVMIGPRGLVKVLDFGLARSVHQGAEDAGGEPGAAAGEAGADVAAPSPAATPGPGGSVAPSLAGDDTRTLVGAVVGTPGYMSPEQAMGVPHDARADMFSFGCVLYEALSGQRAFPAQNDFEAMAAVMYAPHDLTALPEKTPARVRELIDGCLQKDAEARLADIGAVRRAIEDILGIRRASALRTGEEKVATPSNLPKQLPRLIGREAELESCVAQVDKAAVLTLTGVGGCGKTRLALAVGESQLEARPDGVWFADLAPLTTGERVVETVALAIGLGEEPGRPLQQTLIDHLASRRALLILDNCEHLIEACVTLVTGLVQGCPDLRTVATSREALGVQGEAVYAVPTLGLPDAAESGTAKIAASEAVRLFAERAMAVRPEFEIGDDNAAIVADICRHLDGIPLAIELAAARVKILEVAQIQEKLADRFRLLTGGSRTALPRQQTLRATIQWSYDQLHDEERQMMRALSVFAGGWTLGSATAICMESGDEFEVLDLLARLADKSLVVVERGGSGGGAARYRFLETVREYALEQLKATEEEAALRERNVSYFLALAEAAEKQLSGPKQAAWITTLETEHDNLLASIRWCEQSPDRADSALRLAGSISRFWSVRGHYEIARRTLMHALDLGDPEAASAPRATALVRAAQFALVQGDNDAGKPLLERAGEIYRALGDERGVVRTLSGLSSVALFHMEYETSQRLSEESFAIYERLGQKRGMAISRHQQGLAARCRGDLALARTRYEQSLDLLREVGDQDNIALTEGDLAVTLVRAGDHEGARARLTEALLLGRKIAAARVTQIVLDGCAELALALGDARAAIHFSAAGGHIRSEIGLALSPFEEHEHERFNSAIRESLDSAEVAKIISEAQNLDADTVAAQAYAWLEAPRAEP